MPESVIRYLLEPKGGANLCSVNSFLGFSFIIIILKHYLFIYLVTLGLSCSTRDRHCHMACEILVPGIVPCFGKQILYHQTAREVSLLLFFTFYYSIWHDV